jgi:hypothetical protein
MPKGVPGPTWALLSPNKLPDASEVKKILGAIIPDYENPAQNTIPENASSFIPAHWFVEPTVDGNFKVALSKASGQKAYARLGDILNTAFGKDVSNDLHLTSTTVKTYAVRQEIKAFKLLKQLFNKEIIELINQAPPRSKKSVFVIEALKTCLDAEMSSKDAMNRSKKVDVKPPFGEIVAASTGAPSPINLDLKIGGESSDRANIDESHTAKGERIFAIQYRIIKKRSEWPRFGRPKLPLDFDLHDMYIPEGPSMYGDGDDVVDGDSDLDENEDQDDDPIELGDLEHTWNLVDSADKNIVMTTL